MSAACLAAGAYLTACPDQRGESAAGRSQEAATVQETAGAQISPEERRAQKAQAELLDTLGRRIGHATLREGPNGVHLRLQLDGAPPGTRAFHVHETGRCEPDFDAAGSHWNPHGREHGFLNPRGPHMGDMPNIHVSENGQVEAEIFMVDARIIGVNALVGGDGTALILHAGADDYSTDPTGDAGGRIACGVIQR